MTRLHGSRAAVELFPSLSLGSYYHLPGAIPVVPGVTTGGITVCFSAAWALEVLCISLRNRRALHALGDQIPQSHLHSKSCLELAEENELAGLINADGP